MDLEKRGLPSVER